MSFSADWEETVLTRTHAAHAVHSVWHLRHATNVALRVSTWVCCRTGEVGTALINRLASIVVVVTEVPVPLSRSDDEATSISYMCARSLTALNFERLIQSLVYSLCLHAVQAM